MWANEHSIEISAAPEQVLRLWADAARWPDWNDDIERIELIGPFRRRQQDRDDADRR